MHLQNFYSFMMAFYKILRVLWSVSGGQNCPVACVPCFSFLPHRLPFSSSCKQELGTLWFIAFMVRNHSEPLQAARILLGQPRLFELLLWPLIGQLWPLPVGHVDPLKQYRIASSPYYSLCDSLGNIWRENNVPFIPGLLISRIPPFLQVKGFEVSPPFRLLTHELISFCLFLINQKNELTHFRDFKTCVILPLSVNSLFD